jgi:hypothetical protein
MDHSSPSAPVIVGIDGSTAALRAALWAVDEAVSRDTPLRLVHVVPASGHGLDEALADGRDVLHKAWTEVEATGNRSRSNPRSFTEIQPMRWSKRRARRTWCVSGGKAPTTRLGAAADRPPPPWLVRLPLRWLWCGVATPTSRHRSISGSSPCSMNHPNRTRSYKPLSTRHSCGTRRSWHSHPAPQRPVITTARHVRVDYKPHLRAI